MKKKLLGHPTSIQPRPGWSWRRRHMATSALGPRIAAARPLELGGGITRAQGVPHHGHEASLNDCPHCDVDSLLLLLKIALLGAHDCVLCHCKPANLQKPTGRGLQTPTPSLVWKKKACKVASNSTCWAPRSPGAFFLPGILVENMP